MLVHCADLSRLARHVFLADDRPPREPRGLRLTMLCLTFIEPDGTQRVVDGEGSRTLMEAATAGGVSGILAQCGGGCSCGTCHVHIAPEWIQRVGRPSDMESDMLSIASDRRANSRLACQIRLSSQLDGLVVSVAPSQP